MKLEKKELIKFLSSDLKSTHQIAEESNLNWYICFSMLQELYFEGLIEREQVNRATFWRIKNGEQ